MSRIVDHLRALNSIAAEVLVPQNNLAISLFGGTERLAQPALSRMDQVVAGLRAVPAIPDAFVGGSNVAASIWFQVSLFVLVHQVVHHLVVL